MRSFGRELTAAELASRPRSERDVNRALESMGIHERLRRGHGYYFFAEGNAFRWPSQGVYVYHASEMSIGQWVDAYKKLAVGMKRDGLLKEDR
jgi:hypothetical protein